MNLSTTHFNFKMLTLIYFINVTDKSIKLKSCKFVIDSLNSIWSSPLIYPSSNLSFNFSASLWLIFLYSNVVCSLYVSFCICPIVNYMFLFHLYIHYLFPFLFARLILRTHKKLNVEPSSKFINKTILGCLQKLPQYFLGGKQSLFISC
jgi:hypothetical protein